MTELHAGQHLDDTDGQKCACAEHICSYRNSSNILVTDEINSNDERIGHNSYDACQNTEKVESGQKRLLEPFLDDQEIMSILASDDSNCEINRGKHTQR